MSVASVLPVRPPRSGRVQVTLGQLIRFESAAGNRQVRVVDEIRTQGEWDELKDFYLQLRRQIAAQVRAADLDAANLRTFAASVHDKKQDRYRAAADGLARFVRTHRVEVVGAPARALWSEEGLRVSADPEAILRVDGQRYVTKFYLLKGELDPNGVVASLQLLRETHRLPNARVAILDCERGRLLRDTRLNPHSRIVLRTTAMAVANIWKALEFGELRRQEPAVS